MFHTEKRPIKLAEAPAVPRRRIAGIDPNMMGNKFKGPTANQRKKVLSSLDVDDDELMLLLSCACSAIGRPNKKRAKVTCEGRDTNASNAFVTLPNRDVMSP